MRKVLIRFGIPAFAGISSLSIPILLYLLSTGPTCRLKQQGKLPAAVERLYDPLVPIMLKSEPFGRALMQYQQLWLR